MQLAACKLLSIKTALKCCIVAETEKLSIIFSALQEF